MTSVKVKFRPSTAEGRPGNIIYQITHHRTARTIATGYKVYPGEWDEKHSTVIVPTGTNRRPVVQPIFQQIRWDMERLDRIIRNLDSKGREYSPDKVVDEFHKIKRPDLFFEYMENVIVRLQSLNQTGTARNYRSTLNSFKAFRNGEDILLGQVDAILIEDYQSWLRAGGKAPNSVTFYLRILRAVYNRASEEELTQDRKPFRKASVSIGKTRKRALSWKDIKHIKDLDLSSIPSLEFARDIFIFLFICRGMSFIDAAFLKKSDFQGGTITYRRHKTKQQIQIKIVKQIQEIADRYSTDELPYLLPIITKAGNNERKQYESALRRINNQLKKIGRMLKLPLPLTTYTSRHSWATIAKQKGIAIATISDALGHDSQLTTEIYLASIDTSTIDRANDLVIKDL